MITSSGVLAPIRVSGKDQSPDSRLDTRPGLPARGGGTTSWGLLPGYSGGTVPVSHRLPVTLRPSQLGGSIAASARHVNGRPC